MATSRNRLDEEESPYLRQHADNPVNWQPWDEQALAEARERDVPIFLSVGYSACHWCHVMEEESFEDEDVAELLNEKFVPIKVDREERPDVDSIYQSICQMVSGNGGWPLSVWLTPEGKPFYVGTYFPREPRQNMPGFEQLLENIAGSWSDPEERPELEQRAEQWSDAITGELEDVPEEPGELPDESALDSAAQAAVRSADREHGGFGRGQKFPQTGRIHVLLRAYDRTGRDTYREVAVETLDAMADGGLYDHVGGGFHRYCTDRTWTVPHFEKMLYDNAELPRAFLAGYQVTGDERYAEVVTETLDFVADELQHPDGGFFSTLDAQSVPVDQGETGERASGDGGAASTPPEPGADADAEAEEGAFYVWTPQQVHEVVDDETDAELFCDYYGVDETGNFEDRTTVLTVSASIGDLADAYDLSEEAVADRLETARKQVAAARAERPRPRRDEKVLAGWNGLMVSAYAEAALVLDAEHAGPAERALAFVRDHLWDDEEERLSRRFKDGDVQVTGYLEDYAFLGRGALDLYQATGDVDHLAFALDLARAIEREFWDAEAGTLYFTPASGEELVARPQELTDQSTPSSAGVAARLLLALDHFAPDAGFAELARRTLETHGRKLESNPLQHASLVLAADEQATGHLELTVAAESLPTAWRERIGERYLPSRLLSRRPPTGEGLEPWLDQLGLDETPPIWAGREQRDGEPTVYTCRSFTCSPPQTDIEPALEWADDLAPD